MRVDPYLDLNGRCEAALAFYQSALGAELMFMHRFRDTPPGAMGDCAPANPDGVMHATLRIGESLVHASDGQGNGTAISGVALSIEAKSIDEGRRYFDALADGGQVTMPFGKTFWTDGFGMLVDRFGVAWMVNVVH